MRSRNIKPGFFENEDLAELDPYARLLFAGLWCYADREGRFEWRPKRIKALILPYNDVDVESLLMSLHVMTLILKYKIDEKEYGLIKNFKKHLPEPKSEHFVTLPMIDVNKIIHHKNESNNEQNQCHDMSLKCNADSLIPDSLIPDSRARKKKESKPKNSECLIPSDFKITDEMRNWFNKQEFIHIEIEHATDEFVDYWKGEGKLKSDWGATWRNGMRNKEKWAKEAGQSREGKKPWHI